MYLQTKGLFLCFFYGWLLTSSCWIIAQNTPCGLSRSMEELYEEQPLLPAIVEQKRLQIIEAEQNAAPIPNAKVATRIIPVVFHVLHECGIEKVDVAQIENVLIDLNDDFNAENADALQLGDPFYEDQADVDIRFALANIDPSGNATTGITYTATPFTNDGQSFSEQFKKMINWDRATYLNIWVIKHLSNASGYAFYPEVVDGSGNAFRDGIVIRYEYLGTTGTSTAATHGRRHIMAHEVGHWLGLQHAWGDVGDNGTAFTQAGMGNNCNYDDLIDDTPNTIGNASITYPFQINACSDLNNTCSDNNYNGYNSCSNSNPPDNIFNMMDYGAEIMFTEGQKTRMYSYLNASFSDRDQIGIDPSIAFLDINTPVLTFDNYFLQEADSDDGSIYNQINLSLSQGYFKHAALTYPNTDNILQVSNLPVGYTLHIDRDSNDNSKATLYITGTTSNHTDIDDIDDLNVQFNSDAFQNVNYANFHNTTLNDLKIDYKDFGEKYRRFTIATGDSPICADNIPAEYEAVYLDETGYLVVNFEQDTFYMLNESSIQVDILCMPNTGEAVFLPEGSNVQSQAIFYDFRRLTRDDDDPNPVILYHNNYTTLAGQTGYLGMRISLNGCFSKMMYGWMRISVAADGSKICVLDSFYDTNSATTADVVADVGSVDCMATSLPYNPYYAIDSIVINDTLMDDISINTTSQVTLSAGSSYDFSFIQDGNGAPSQNNGKYQIYWAAWIDFNDDGFYDIDEMVVYSGRIIDAIGGLNINMLDIPANAPTGVHEMVVIANIYNYSYELIASYSINPCGTVQFGDVHRFNVLIDDNSIPAGPVACQSSIVRGPYLSPGADGQAINAVKVLWRAENNETFKFCYKPVNTLSTSYICQNVTGTLQNIAIPFDYGDNVTNCDVYNYEVSVPIANGSDYDYEIRCLDNSSLKRSVIKPYPNPTTKAPVDIWVSGDAGYAYGYTLVQQAYADYVGDINNDGQTDAFDIKDKVDMLIVLGDNAYAAQAQYDPVLCNTNVIPCPNNSCRSDGGDYAYQKAFFDPLENILDNNIAWTTIGNHEVDYQMYDENIKEFANIFPYINQNKGYYSYDYGKVHFVCLNSEIRDPLFSENVNDMKTWLINDLTNAQQTADWTVVSFHHPIHSAAPKWQRNTLISNTDAETFLSEIEPDMRTMIDNIAEVLDSFEVDLVMTGHNHHYERSFLVDGYYNANDPAQPIFDDNNPNMLLDDGCNGCLQTYNASPNNYNYNNFHDSYFTKDDKGTVYIVMGTSSKVDNFAAVHNFFDHPMMRPFDVSSTFSDGNNTVSQGGRGLLQTGSGHLSIRNDSLIFEYIAYDQNTDSYDIKDRFVIHKPTDCMAANASCDCNGEDNGFAFMDNCGNCVAGSTSLSPCTQDCNGDFGGTAYLDNCNTCVNGNTGLIPCTQDCFGDFGGTAYLDNCNTCVDGNTGLSPCTQDCFGDFGGTAYLDNCNTCVDGNTGLTPCGTDCNGDLHGNAFTDICGNCVGGNTGILPCNTDCNGDLNGVALVDACGICVGGNTGLLACNIDCNSVASGNAFTDTCGNCVGGNTGMLPCNTDCNGDLNGNAFIDACGICVGGNTGTFPCNTDCNGDLNGTAYIDNCGDCVGGNTGLSDCGITFCDDDSLYHSTNLNNLSGTYHAYSHISSQANLQSNYIEYKAGDNIDLLSDFNVPLGTTFDAIIENCTPGSNKPTTPNNTTKTKIIIPFKIKE